MSCDGKIQTREKPDRSYEGEREALHEISGVLLSSNESDFQAI
jgi:hypothetical protein